MNAYDIETYIDKKSGYFVPFCCCFIIDNKSYSFYHSHNGKDVITDSINFILDNFKNKLIYVHNINFDGFILLDYISKTDIEIECLIKEMNIYKIVFKKKKNKLEFRCSYKILPDSLKNIATSFGIGKKDIFPHKFSSIENLFYYGEIPSREYFNSDDEYFLFKENKKIFDFKKECVEYCLNDVNITVQFVNKIKEILKEFDVEIEKCYSAPSLSLKIFIKKFNNNKISFNLKKKIDDAIRKSYFGGRCEVYGNPINGEFIQYYDFSGMYGQCMEEKFPHGEIKINYDVEDIRLPGFYFIEYESNMDYPILPHKSFMDGKLMFTNGKNIGIFWFEEILLFRERGGVVTKINFSITFSKFDYIFKDFVIYFNNLKKKGEIYKKFAKLMINSLYGRMGMSSLSNEFIFIKKEEYKWYDKNKEIVSYKILNGIVLLEIKSNDVIKVKNNIALASCISSKARIKLYKAQEDVLKNGGRLLYSDTDSIFAAYKKDVTKEKHGNIDWSKEGKKIKDCVFISSKTYALDMVDKEEVRVKGFNLNNFSFKKIKESFYNNQSIQNNEKFIQKKDFKIFLSHGDKILKLNNYNKRKFSEDKKNTNPLIKINDYDYL